MKIATTVSYHCIPNGHIFNVHTQRVVKKKDNFFIILSTENACKPCTFVPTKY